MTGSGPLARLDAAAEAVAAALMGALSILVFVGVVYRYVLLSPLAWVEEVVRDFPRQVDELRAGKLQVLGFLTGQVMKRSGGRAEARRVQELLRAAAGAPGDAP